MPRTRDKSHHAPLCKKNKNTMLFHNFPVYCTDNVKNIDQKTWEIRIMQIYLA